MFVCNVERDGLQSSDACIVALHVGFNQALCGLPACHGFQSAPRLIRIFCCYVLSLETGQHPHVSTASSFD